MKVTRNVPLMMGNVQIGFIEVEYDSDLNLDDKISFGLAMITNADVVDEFMPDLNPKKKLNGFWIGPSPLVKNSPYSIEGEDVIQGK